MSEPSNNDRRLLPPQLIGVGALLILLLAFLLIMLFNQGDGRPMKPLRPTPASGELVIDAQPLLVTFDQLNNDPNSLLDKRIRVTGDFLRLRPPDCLLFNGPTFRWALVSGALQLDAKGFEAIVRLIPEGTSMTVEGFWRRYTGPLGCGKKPAAGTVWYLDVTQIVQPNPLPNFGGVPVDVLPPFGEEGPPPAEEGTPAAGEGTVTATPTGTITPSATPTVTGTPDEFGGTITPTATATPTASPSGTQQPTVTGTPPTPTRTPTPTPTATFAPGTTPTAVPPTPTRTSGGYPGPAPTPVTGTATPTPDPYPGGG